MLKNRLQFAARMRRRIARGDLPPDVAAEGLRLARNLVRHEVGARKRAAAKNAEAGRSPSGRIVDTLRAAFHDNREPRRQLRHELSYRQMLLLADIFDGWAQGASMTPEQSGKLMGWAEGMRALAQQVGEAWNPPPVDPKELGPMGFIARKLEG